MTAITADYLDWFVDLFQGRADVHGEGKGRRVTEPVTPELIRQHLGGERRVGIYPVAGDELNQVRFAAVDLDVDDWDLACKIHARLAHYGLTAYIERTKSKGWHIWVFFRSWTLAWKVRAVLSTALEDLREELPGPVEIFPKQDSVPEGGYGNYINLPMFGADAKQGRTVFVVPGGEPKVVPMRALIEVRHSEADLDETIEINGIEWRSPSWGGREADGEAFEEVPFSEFLPCALRMLRQGARQGYRNEWAYRLAIHYKRCGIDGVAARKSLQAWNQSRTVPPLPGQEIDLALKSAYTGQANSLGCERPEMQAVCATWDCPVYRHDHPEGPKSAGAEEVEQDAGIVLKEHSLREGKFRFQSGQTEYVLDGLTNVKGDLRCALSVYRAGKPAFVGKVNLKSQRSRASVARELDDQSIEDASAHLLSVAESVSRRLEEAAEAERSKEAKKRQGYVLTDEQRDAAKAWLEEHPQVLREVLRLTDELGVAREQTNRLLLYLIFSSRKLLKPINGIGKGHSASGKSFTAERVLQLFPPEDVIDVTRMTPHALEYADVNAFQHKVLFVRELPGSEESDYTIRSFMSEGDIRIMTVEKDAKGGGHATQDKTVKGPLCFYTTTTAPTIHDENETRLLPIYSDETREMTEAAFTAASREAIEGSLAKPRDLEVARHVQRMLKRGVFVTIPYAYEIERAFPSEMIRSRRDYPMFLRTIQACAFVHQHQRDWTTYVADDLEPREAIIASSADYAIVKDLIQGQLMRVFADVAQGEEELLKYVRKAMRDYAMSSEVPAGWSIEEDEVWCTTTVAAARLGKSGRTMLRLVRELEERGLFVTRAKSRPLMFRATGSAMHSVWDFRLPTISTEDLFERYPEGRDRYYDPLS